MILYFVIGYVVAVLFPVPWITPYIVGLWSKVLGLAKDAETLVEGANAGSVVVPSANVAAPATATVAANTIAVTANTVAVANTVAPVANAAPVANT